MSNQTDSPVIEAANLAQRQRGEAYAPYSDFPMGAGIVGQQGEQVGGVLIENVSLGLAMCAERVALFAAVTQKIRPQVLALCSARTEGELTFPCGSCLQVALEIAGPDLVVVAVDPEGEMDQRKLSSLLPMGPKRFSPFSSDK